MNHKRFYKGSRSITNVRNIIRVYTLGVLPRKGREGIYPEAEIFSTSISDSTRSSVGFSSKAYSSHLSWIFLAIQYPLKRQSIHIAPHLRPTVYSCVSAVPLQLQRGCFVGICVSFILSLFEKNAASGTNICFVTAHWYRRVLWKFVIQQL